MNNRLLSSLVVFTVVLFVGCGDNSPVGNSNLTKGNQRAANSPVPTATVDELASGKKVYEVNCMICHRSEGTGGKLAVEGKKLSVEDLTSEKIRSMTDEKIIGYIAKGVPDEGMPAFKEKLSEGEMRDVVKYIRTEFHGQ